MGDIEFGDDVEFVEHLKREKVKLLGDPQAVKSAAMCATAITLMSADDLKEIIEEDASETMSGLKNLAVGTVLFLADNLPVNRLLKTTDIRNLFKRPNG